MHEVWSTVAADERPWRRPGRRAAAPAIIAGCLACTGRAEVSPRWDDPLRPQRFGLSTAPMSQFYDVVLQDCVLSVTDHQDGPLGPGECRVETRRVDLRVVRALWLVPIGSPGMGYRDLVAFTAIPDEDAPAFDPRRSDLPIRRRCELDDGQVDPEPGAHVLTVIAHDDAVTDDLVRAVEGAHAACRAGADP